MTKQKIKIKIKISLRKAAECPRSKSCMLACCTLNNLRQLFQTQLPFSPTENNTHLLVQTQSEANCLTAWFQPRFPVCQNTHFSQGKKWQHLPYVDCSWAASGFKKHRCMTGTPLHCYNLDFSPCLPTPFFKL